MKESAEKDGYAVYDISGIDYHPTAKNNVIIPKNDKRTQKDLMTKELVKQRVIRQRTYVSNFRNITEVDMNKFVKYGPDKRRDNGDDYHQDLRISIYSIIYSSVEYDDKDNYLSSLKKEIELFRYFHEEILHAPNNEVFVLFRK